MLAIFDNLGFSELLIVLVFAILVFGKRLPEVAAQAGASLGKLRRSLQDVKNETGIDADIQKIKRDLQNVVPRDLSMGEMARIASAELEKRMMATDEKKEAKPSALASDDASTERTHAADASRASLPPDAAHASTAPDAHASTTSDAAHASTGVADAGHASASDTDAARAQTSDSPHPNAAASAAPHANDAPHAAETGIVRPD